MYYPANTNLTQYLGQFFYAARRLAAEFTEIESGTRNDLPQLAVALDICRKRKACLVIAKLDWLARNVYFISGLREGEIEFVVVDLPQADRLTLHILAAVAKHERDMISQQVKDALRAAKRRGTRLGNPTPDSSLTRGRQAISKHVRERQERQYPLIKQSAESGLSLRGIAGELNRWTIPMARGKLWNAAGIARVIRAIEGIQA